MLGRLNNLSKHFSAKSSLATRSFTSSMPKKFDYLVIGAGSGGIASARRAALLGKKVGLIEHQRIGGTCVNVGCVPKKVMFNVAQFLEDAHHTMPICGVENTSSLKLDFAKFKQARDSYVARLNKIYKNNVDGDKIEYIQGKARFVDEKVVTVDESQDDTTYTADHILIATGSAPRQHSFPGVEHCIDSNDIFDMESLPESITVIGAGYIGIEIAQILNAMGVKTTILVRSAPLNFVDRDVINVLTKEMEKTGINLMVKQTHERVEKRSDGQLDVVLTSGERVTSEKVLLAIGRPPNTDNLGLEKTKVALTSSGGYINVDEFQNTSQPGIYALGDVTKGIALTPVAVRAGRILSERLFNNRPQLKMNFDNVATIIFSHPPIGTIGLSENQAVDKFGDENIKTYTSQFGNLFYGPIDPNSGVHKPQSFFKLICHNEPDTGKERVVGVHGVGRGIDEMMQGFSVAVNMGATKQDFDNSVAIHPTASEEFVTMGTKYE